MECTKCGKETGEKWKKLCDDCFKKSKDAAPLVTMEQVAQAAAESSATMRACRDALLKAYSQERLFPEDIASLNSVYIQTNRRLFPFKGRSE